MIRTNFTRARRRAGARPSGDVVGADRGVLQLLWRARTADRPGARGYGQGRRHVEGPLAIAGGGLVLVLGVAELVTLSRLRRATAG